MKSRLRRQRSVPAARDRARETATLTDLQELRQRVAAMEDVCGEINRTLNVQFQRMAAIQAQLDHLAAKITGR